MLRSLVGSEMCIRDRYLNIYSRALLFILLFLFSIIQIRAQSPHELKTPSQKKYYLNASDINFTKMLPIVKSNPVAYDYMKHAKGMNGISKGIVFVGGFLIGWPIGTHIGGGEANWNLVLYGAGTALLSVPFSLSSISNAKKSIKIYNSELDLQTLIEIKVEHQLPIETGSVKYILNF